VCVHVLYFSHQGHPTLTYLDLRSNAISNTGLNSLTGPLAGNHVLSYLDLRGNEFSDESFLSLQASLNDAGAQLHINWAHANSAPARSVPLMMEDAALFEAPQKVR
jgi:Leucine-rich repeat (LRR) protein